MGEFVKNIAVFASGRGSNFKKIFHSIKEGKIPARVCCLITDNSKAGAIEFAKENDIPVYTIPPKQYHTSEDFGKALLEVLNNYNIEWIVLAGYLKKIPDIVVEKYANRILNIHPALLPAFGGKGMYGMHVHEAVFVSGAKVSGVTVHLVNNEYDRGPIVMQRPVDIESCRSPEEIASTVLKVEHQLYSEALKKILTTDFQVIGNRVIFNKK